MGANTTGFPRPKIVPPASKNDLIVEAIALLGLLLGIGLLVYGCVNLPEYVPHIGSSGGIDSYGSKWILLVFMFISYVVGYGLLTIAGRYPYYLNYPGIITAENAHKHYRLIRNMLRWIKVIFVWMTSVLTWLFILVMPNDPGQSHYSILVILLFPIAMVIVIGYYLMKLLQEGYSSNTTIKKH